MRKWDQDTEEFMERWTEKEVRATIGASPRSTVQDNEEYEPTGPHAWFGYVVAEIVAPLALRRMSETWEARPSYPEWSDYAPAIRRAPTR